MKKKTFDAVAFMRRRREELSRTYDGVGWQRIEERIQQTLKDDPLWGKATDRRTPVSSRKKKGDCPE